MSTFTSTNKSSANFSSANKSSASFGTSDKTDFGVQYILTDILDYILVGAASDETLIFTNGIAWSGESKS